MADNILGIPRGTTPQFVLDFDETVDLTQASSVYVTFGSGYQTITKTDTDLEISARSITVSLTQEETLAFQEGPLLVQTNWVTQDGRRYASEIETYQLTKNLLDKVVE